MMWEIEIVILHAYLLLQLQRTESPYITTSGLKFLAPELDSRSLASSDLLAASADMYNFGLLILWVFQQSLFQISIALFI